MHVCMGSVPTTTAARVSANMAKPAFMLLLLIVESSAFPNLVAGWRDGAFTY